MQNNYISGEILSRIFREGCWTEDKAVFHAWRQTLTNNLNRDGREVSLIQGRKPFAQLTSRVCKYWDRVVCADQSCWSAHIIISRDVDYIRFRRQFQDIVRRPLDALGQQHSDVCDLYLWLLGSKYGMCIGQKQERLALSEIVPYVECYAPRWKGVYFIAHRSDSAAVSSRLLDSLRVSKVLRSLWLEVPWKDWDSDPRLPSWLLNPPCSKRSLLSLPKIPMITEPYSKLNPILEQVSAKPPLVPKNCDHPTVTIDQHDTTGKPTNDSWKAVVLSINNDSQLQVLDLRCSFTLKPDIPVYLNGLKHLNLYGDVHSILHAMKHISAKSLQDIEITDINYPIQGSAPIVLPTSLKFSPQKVSIRLSIPNSIKILELFSIRSLTHLIFSFKGLTGNNVKLPAITANFLVLLDLSELYGNLKDRLGQFWFPAVQDLALHWRASEKPCSTLAEDLTGFLTKLPCLMKLQISDVNPAPPPPIRRVFLPKPITRVSLPILSRLHLKMSGYAAKKLLSFLECPILGSMHLDIAGGTETWCDAIPLDTLSQIEELTIIDNLPFRAVLPQLYRRLTNLKSLSIELSQPLHRDDGTNAGKIVFDPRFQCDETYFGPLCRNSQRKDMLLPHLVQISILRGSQPPNGSPALLKVAKDRRKLGIPLEHVNLDSHDGTSSAFTPTIKVNPIGPTDPHAPPALWPQGPMDPVDPVCPGLFNRPSVVPTPSPQSLVNA